MDSDQQGRLEGPASGLESSAELLCRAREGDEAALDHLMARHMPRLRRWASGRLPRGARGLMDTDDLVQATLLQTLRRINDFEPRHEGALQAYLRQAVLNRIRTEIQKSRKRVPEVPIDGSEPDPAASPLEEAVGRRALERYERALERLREEDRAAIVGRIEMDMDYKQLAEALGKPSADASRMAVSRALVRLAREMNREG